MIVERMRDARIGDHGNLLDVLLLGSIKRRRIP